MEFTLRQAHNWTLIRFQGRMDSYTYDAVVEKLNILLRMGRKHIAIDLGQTDFVNFLTLQYFRSISKKLEDKNGELIFLTPRPEVRSQLELFQTFQDKIRQSLPEVKS